MGQEIKEFRVFNKNIEQISVYYGFFLIIWGVTVSFISGSSSFTSYIPSYIGLMILTFSFLSVKFLKKKKFFMHLVASLGLITTMGGLDFIRLILKGILFENFWVDISKLMMLMSGSIFVYLCFMSFRFIRNTRKN